MAKSIRFLLFFSLSLVFPITKCYDHTRLLRKKSALFVFGDSAFDAGNNNYINTSIQADYFPYGETFFKFPTGRFSDGRLVPDFIAEYAKLPFIPPYLQLGNREFTHHGVNFASAGAGALVETRQGMVVDLQTQLSYFKNVDQLLRQKLGDAGATDLLSEAVYLFSVGGNDYAFVFETNSSVVGSFSPQQFVGLVIGNITSVIQDIYKIGGRKFAFQTIWPLACTPYLRALSAGNKGVCLDQITPYLQLHNKELSKLLQKLQGELKGFKFSLLEFYAFLEERMNYPYRYGFKEGMVACCGSGPYRGIFSCGGRRGVKEYYLCDNVHDYVFFDAAHPTERVYHQFAKQAWSGKPTFKGSYNLQALFNSK